MFCRAVRALLYGRRGKRRCFLNDCRVARLLQNVRLVRRVRVGDNRGRVRADRVRRVSDGPSRDAVVHRQRGVHRRHNDRGHVVVPDHKTFGENARGDVAPAFRSLRIAGECRERPCRFAADRGESVRRDCRTEDIRVAGRHGSEFRGGSRQTFVGLFGDEIRFDPRISTASHDGERGQRTGADLSVELDAGNAAILYGQTGRGRQNRTGNWKNGIPRDDAVNGRRRRFEREQVVRI